MTAFEMNSRISQAKRSDLNNADRTREFNDAFRRDPRQGGVVLSRELRDIQPHTLTAVLRAVRTFDGFTNEDDPYDEHDFAAVVVNGERYIWKIDYYDLDMRRLSPDPSDPAFTQRVITIMRAREY